MVQRWVQRFLVQNESLNELLLTPQIIVFFNEKGLWVGCELWWVVEKVLRIQEIVLATYKTTLVVRRLERLTTDPSPPLVN